MEKAEESYFEDYYFLVTNIDLDFSTSWSRIRANTSFIFLALVVEAPIVSFLGLYREWLKKEEKKKTKRKTPEPTMQSSEEEKEEQIQVLIHQYHKGETWQVQQSAKRQLDKKKIDPSEYTREDPEH